jgi:hypothetical protein
MSQPPGGYGQNQPPVPPQWGGYPQGGYPPPGQRGVPFPGYAPNQAPPPHRPRRKGPGKRNAILLILGGCLVIGVIASAVNGAKTAQPVAATTSPTATVKASSGAAAVKAATKPAPPSPAPTTPVPTHTTHAASAAVPPAPAHTTAAAIPPPAPARTTAAAIPPPAPAHTTAAAVPPPAPPAAAAACSPLTNGGKCYEPGEFCRAGDHNLSGVAGDGKAITCEDNDGWRWEPA